MTNYYWVRFEAAQPLCVGAKDELAARLKAKLHRGENAFSVDPLPYPGGPSIGVGHMPRFCLTPEECAGHTACPKNPSCSE